MLDMHLSGTDPTQEMCALDHADRTAPTRNMSETTQIFPEISISSGRDRSSTAHLSQVCIVLLTLVLSPNRGLHRPVYPARGHTPRSRRDRRITRSLQI